MQVMQEKSRLNTLKIKDSPIYRKIKNLNEKGLSKYSPIFQKCMFQGITNITLSRIGPNFTSSHNAVGQKDRGGKDLYSVEGDVFNSSWPHAKCRMKILNFVHLKN